MPTSAVVAGTPNYVLMDGRRCIGPKIVQVNTGIECSAIYGFSDKGRYDRFCRNSQGALTPYPLVKVYLRNEAAAPGDGLKLVVLDAVGPHEPCLHAATMQAVLEAQESRTTHVSAAHLLMFDQEASTYRLEEASV